MTASESDGWGCDYGLLRADGSLVEAPYAYRDPRTDGMMEQVFAKVPRERIYAITGVQFLWFNTLYQLYAACQTTPAAIAAADRLGTIPDLLNHWLSGELRAEYTNATTTQCIDAVVAHVVTRDCSESLKSQPGYFPSSSRLAPCSGDPQRGQRGACRHSGRGARVPRYCVCVRRCGCQRR